MLILILLSFIQSCFVPSDYRPQEFIEVKTSNKVFFLKKSGGIVLECINDTLVRIDNSYDNKIQNNSLNFVYRDEIYRFGGYGFYHEHKVLVKYNTLINSWEEIDIKNLEDLDGFSHIGFHFIKGDHLLFFGTESRQEKNFQKGFSIDLKKWKLEDQLVLNQQFLNPYSYTQNNNVLILFYLDKSEIIIYNIDSDTLSSFNIPKEISDSVVDESEIKLVDGKLYFTINDIDFKKVDFPLDFLVVNNNSVLLDESLYSKKIIYRDYWVVLLIPIVLFFIGIIFRVLYRKEKSLVLTSNELFLNNKVLIDDKEQIKILNLLSEKTMVYNQELNDLFNHKNQNSIHVNRYKNQLIDKINLKLHDLFNEDVIRKSKDESDKRISIYHLKENCIHYKSN